MDRPHRKVCFWVFGMVLLLGLSSESAAADGEAVTPPLDPIVEQVVEMLNAGVSDSLILQWLESTGRRPGDIGGPGLIALTEAKASEQLMSTLLELVGEQRDDLVEVGSGSVPSPVDSEAGVQPAARTAPGSVVEGGVDTVVRLSARRVWVDEDEPDSPREPRWSVFLYLDGEFVAWVRPDANGEPVEARRQILPGRHELLVVLQRYESGRDGWRYESLAVPHRVDFEIAAGDAVEIDVDLKRIWGLWRDRKDGGPMSYSVRQGGEMLTEQRAIGGNPDRWQPICEDVEANFPGKRSVPRAFRSAMNRCVRWNTLWAGAGASTSRSEILTRLAEDDFEPPVR